MTYREHDESAIRENWVQSAVFTDVWNEDRYDHIRQVQGVDFRKLMEDELLQGELSATTFRVGCYIVRKTLRVYNAHYVPGSAASASKEDVELAKKDIEKYGGIDFDIHPELRIAHEISARHCDNPGNDFTHVCHAIVPNTYKWHEVVGPIYTVKASASIPDEYASLLVCLIFFGDSHTDDSWYRLDPTGKITKFTVNSSSSIIRGIT